MTRLGNNRNVAASAVAACLSLVAIFFANVGTAGAHNGEPHLAGSVAMVAAQSGLDTRPGDALFPLASAEFQNAQRVASQFWGGNACKGQVTVTWERLDEGTNATASWRNPTDAWDNAGENFDCEITLNSHADYDFPKLCTVMAHELGHLLGKPHADQPGQLMSALYTDALPACVQADPTAAVAQPIASTSKKTTSTQGLRKAKTRTTAKRCLSRFSAAKRGSRTKRCGKSARSAKRAQRSRR